MTSPQNEQQKEQRHMIHNGLVFPQKNRDVTITHDMTDQEQRPAMNFLAYETEEILAEAIKRIRNLGYSPENYDLTDILNRIAREMKLSSCVRRVISNQHWVEGFTNRWGEKLCLGKRALASLSTNLHSSHQDGLRNLQLHKLLVSSSSQIDEPDDLKKSPMVATDKGVTAICEAHNVQLGTDQLYRCSTSSNLNIREPFFNVTKRSKTTEIPFKKRKWQSPERECITIISSESEEEGVPSDPRKKQRFDSSGESRKNYDNKKIASVKPLMQKPSVSSTPSDVIVIEEDEQSFVQCNQKMGSSMLADTNLLSVRNKDSTKNLRHDLKIIHDEVKHLEAMCLACGSQDNIKAKHPLFIGGLCEEHKKMLHEWFFKYDADGYHSYCSVCCMGTKVVLCDVQDCGRCYCKQCLDTLVGQGTFQQAVNSELWVCNFCNDSPHGLLRKRPEWQEEIQRLFQDTGTKSEYPPFPVPAPIPVFKRRPIRVLSLFDGIATGAVALKQLGLQIEKFVASEIDEDAIRLVQNKHPEVIHIGDITKITDDEIHEMGPFDLLLGGSPCNDLSGANPRRKGLLDAEGSGCLFFDFYRVLRTIQPPRDSSGKPQRPFFWLFENVVSMKSIEKQRISRFLQCDAKMADARMVSAAARPRLFWGNLPGLQDRKITPGVSDRLTVQECLEVDRKALVTKLNTITTKYTCLYQGQTRQAPAEHDGKADVLWTTEVERVFGVPEHYTDVNNLGPRERLALLGKSWSVPVVRQLLSPLKEYFSGVQQSSYDGRNSIVPWWN